MLMKSKFAFISLLIFWLSACDQACDVNVTSVAKFDNRSAAAQSLTVCVRGAPKAATLNLEINQNNEVKVANFTSKRIKTGGPSNACDPKEQLSGVFLTTESFKKVKFCHNTETTAEIVVVALSLTCPGGYIEQTAPVDSCN